MNSEIEILKSISPTKLILVCGLPGIAYVGKIPVDYIIEQLKAELIGEVYSNHFPPYVIINKDGLVELLRNELYCLKDDAGQFIVFLSGNTQAFSPEGQYEIVEKVLDWAIENKLKRVVSLAALVTDRPFDVPRVYCSTTSDALLEEAKKLGVQPLDQGVIGGENGLIIGLARRKKVEGICLLTETHGYQTPTGEYVMDPRAAPVTLNVLTKLLDLKVDMEPMEKRIVEMDEALARMAEIEKRMREEMQRTSKKPSYVT
jgi:uncharacterized protein (TIGR00162 family)